jgi:hypothetical protein
MAAAPGPADGGGKAPGDGPLLAGRWRLGQRMGAGNQAETYLATEVARRVEVVVKRVKLGAGWKSFELHERETKVLGQLRHAGVPRLLGAVEEPAGHVQPGHAAHAGRATCATSLAASGCPSRAARHPGPRARDPRLPRDPVAAGGPPRHQAVEPGPRSRRHAGAGRLRRRRRQRRVGQRLDAGRHLRLHGARAAPRPGHAGHRSVRARRDDRGAAGGVEPEDVPRKGLARWISRSTCRR